MSEQAKALELADWLEILASHKDAWSPDANRVAAAELRRLHEVNAALLKAVQLYLEWTEAEEDHSKADFYERMEMCRQADQAARAANALALGQ